MLQATVIGFSAVRSRCLEVGVVTFRVYQVQDRWTRAEGSDFELEECFCWELVYERYRCMEGSMLL